MDHEHIAKPFSKRLDVFVVLLKKYFVILARKFEKNWICFCFCVFIWVLSDCHGTLLQLSSYLRYLVFENINLHLHKEKTRNVERTKIGYTRCFLFSPFRNNFIWDFVLRLGRGVHSKLKARTIRFFNAAKLMLALLRLVHVT